MKGAQAVAAAMVAARAGCAAEAIWARRDSCSDSGSSLAASTRLRPARLA